MMDGGFDGMQRTLEVLRNQGMTTVGSRYAGEERWSVTEVNGVKIGLVAYTYETTGPTPTVLPSTAITSQRSRRS